MRLVRTEFDQNQRAFTAWMRERRVNEVADDDLLYMYARFKQVTSGNCTDDAPFVLVTASQKKVHAWLGQRDRDPVVCMSEYHHKFAELRRLHGS